MTQDEIQAVLADALQDKYEILRWVGGGGMANVYLARHRIHGALFAVKVLSTDLAQDERIVARFVQEARTSATLAGHPNIVPVFDIGAEAGLYYLIMQYVEGEDLCRYMLQHGRFAPRDAARITCQVGDALIWASAKGVVHRDLKPSNLYLDQNGRILVLDFGIAKATDVPSNLTAATERLGTVYYMSPEQILAEQCDSRSDLYSLGVVFFEMLSGRKPFDGDSCRAIEIAHVQVPPPNIQELNPLVPDEYVKVLEKLLAKRPDDRYQGARQLVNEFNAMGITTAPLDLRPHLTLIDRVVSPVTASDETQLSSMGSPATPIEAAVGQLTSMPTKHTPSPLSSFQQPLAGSRVAEIAAPQPPENTPQEQAALPVAPSSNRGLMAAVAILALCVVAAALYLLIGKPKAPRIDTAKVSTDSKGAGVALPKVKLDRLGGRMRLVPAGDYIFGDDADHQSPNGRETIRLPAFYVDETEVSNSDYLRFCEETHHKAPNSPTFNEHPDFPATTLSFDEAQDFATWMGKRLPNEKEWEKAARGTDGRIYPWGNEPWTDAPQTTQPVLSYPIRKSPEGAYNMAGNVAEWTTTHYPVGEAEIADMTKMLHNSKFSRDWKVIKGGYFGADKNAQVFWKTYMRRGFPRDLAISGVIGFRCVTDPK